MPKTIAILHYTGLPVIGGVEIIIDAHARLLNRAGYKVKVIVGEGPGGDTLPPEVKTVVIPEIVSSGGPLRSVLKALGDGEVPATFEDAVKKVDKKMSSALRGVDVCCMHNVMTMHFNLVLTEALARIMKRRKSTRFIAWTHDITFGDPRYESHQHGRHPWSLIRQPVQGCDYCVISKQRQRDLRKLFKVPAKTLPVIYDGIDVPRHFHLTRRVEGLYYKENLANTEIIALSPARIVRRKNLGVGMEIVAALKKMGKSVRWIITGAPDPHNPESMKYYRMLKGMRKKLGLQKEVIFLCDRFDKEVRNRDLRGLYRMSDVLLFPSEREGFGLPVLEAGLSRLLVVISDIPVLREVAGRGAMTVKLGGNLNVVAKNIMTAIKKRQSHRYRKKVMSTYSWEMVYKNRIQPAIEDPGSVWPARKP
ncbi:hypothetical protein BVX94_02965 [bacterium B17]|nr:hypothetical protein BVX94_02965 [bacterium B17]